MTKPVRANDPCPCGSRRKFKKCCQAEVERTEFAFRRNRQLFNQLIPDLLQYAMETSGPELVDEAWEDFHLGEPDEEFDPNLPMAMTFLCWFFFNWVHEAVMPGVGGTVKTTVAESFMREANLTQDDKTWLHGVLRKPYSLFQVVEIKPGLGATFFDLLRQVEYQVIDREGSEHMIRGEVVYGAVTEQTGMTAIIGTGPYTLPPFVKQNIEELRQELLEEAELLLITDEVLRDFDADVREFYLDELAHMFEPLEMENIDKEPLTLQTVYFEIESADRAFHALKDLAGDTSDEDLLKDATIKDGEVEHVSFLCYGGDEETRELPGQPAAIGAVEIDGPKLSVMVSSSERAEYFRELIEERLGGAAKFEATVIDPMQPEMDEFSADEDFVTDDEDFSPEEREEIEKHARKHWKDWMDIPVPALEDRTPREAAQTAEGRTLLEELMLFYESDTIRQMPDIFQPDVPALRRELGLD